jgi:Na+-driven multidrug efflux pump
MVLFGIGFGLMPVVGFSSGARLFQRLRESVFVALKVSVFFAAVASILLEIFSGQIVGIFSNDPALVAIATPALRIFASALILTAPIVIFINMFLGLGKGTLAMFLLFFRDTIAFIPLLIILPFWFGLWGVWLALPIANLIALFAVIFWAKKELRRFETK